MKINDKLILPVAIIASSLIVGGFHYATQINKQDSIEKQKQMEIAQEKMKIERDEKREEKKEKERKECYSYAEEAAENLLKTKSEMNPTNKIWKDAVERGLYLSEDFDKYYEDCLSSVGLKK